MLLLVLVTSNIKFETCLVHTEPSIFLKGTFTVDGYIGTSIMRYL